MPASHIYSLTNTGYGDCQWSIAGLPSWITVSQTSGTLNPGESVSVTAEINDTANNLAQGGYSGVASFINQSNGCGGAALPISLAVGREVYVKDA